MRLLRILVVLFVLLNLTASRKDRRPILGDHPNVEATRVPLDAADPARRQVGALTYLGGVVLTSRDLAFGGFSSLSVAGDRFTLLSDYGDIVRFRMDAAFRLSEPEFGDLPAGPRTGWQKHERDSESMAVDPVSGAVWVGFEAYNEIWRYGPGLTKPANGAFIPAMAHWESNGGAESLVRLHDGRFLVIAETDWRDRPVRDLLLFPGDPVAKPDSAMVASYQPPAGYDPSDATELPDGRVLVLNRRFSLPFRWSAVLTLIDPRGVKAGQVLVGREVARFDAPLTVDNYEGLAITREGGTTILWMVSDDNQLFLQRTLLMKFRIDL
ncbi:MAG: esterase-like activity of phytase family protein [Sphingomonas sp.]|uniref:esterase-like activity of phytase family protein n=1 Tax=Sphingomonas sp. TaxID=28214 RepID=UPI001AD5A10D|nr:esterase-like activity of phytase family protein [Sphingomonas sp.]MBN8816628.1 esterase-like activity of phytase family protein [Sphingomonas sp.]